jgi:uncharacterized membrane protein YphA (DoxX/SURF4 family)
MIAIKFIINLSAVIAAILSGVFWVRAASAKVEVKEPREGVGYGGTPINVKDHTGAVIDLGRTYALQSKWNAYAAWASAVTAFLAGVAFLLGMMPWQG